MRVRDLLRSFWSSWDRHKRSMSCLCLCATFYFYLTWTQTLKNNYIQIFLLTFHPITILLSLTSFHFTYINMIGWIILLRSCKYFSNVVISFLLFYRLVHKTCPKVAGCSCSRAATEGLTFSRKKLWEFNEEKYSVRKKNYIQTYYIMYDYFSVFKK